MTSQRIQILRLLAKGKHLTPLTALRLCGTLSLSQRIGSLKKEGWNITSRMIRIGRKRVACYSMVRK